MYSYFKIYFYVSNFASIGRFDLVIFPVESPVNDSIKLENSSACKDYGGIDASLLCCPVHLCHLTCLHFLCVQGKSSLSEVKSM